MQFITARELKTQAAKVWRDLEKEQDLVLTHNGKPVAVISSLAEDDLEETLRDIRVHRGFRALKRLQQNAKAKGLDKLSMNEINAEIKAWRKERRGRL